MLRMILPALALAIGAAPAEAALVSIDLHSAGDGLLTRDTDTDLEWLDITETAGKLPTDVAGLIGASGPYAGFRWATSSEFTTLYTDAGIPVSHYSTSLTAKTPEDIARAQTLQSFLEHKKPYSDVSLTAGHLSGGQFGLIGVYDIGSPQMYYRAETYGVSGVASFAHIGVYLVRDAAPVVPSATTGVPEPATWAMMIAGFGLVGGAMRRRGRVAFA